MTMRKNLKFPPQSRGFQVQAQIVRVANTGKTWVPGWGIVLASVGDVVIPSIRHRSWLIFHLWQHYSSSRKEVETKMQFSLGKEDRKPIHKKGKCPRNVNTIVQKPMSHCPSLVPATVRIVSETGNASARSV